MSSKRDYYEVLSVSRDADGATIKKAFRKLALELHPDRNPSQEAAEAFREAQEAYEILSNEEKRSLYDRFGHAGVKGSAGYSTSSDDIFGGFQSIFEDFFGTGARQGPVRGDDLLYRLNLTFREAVLGCEKQIEISRREICETCDGSGAKPGTSSSACRACGGKGKVNFRQGFFVIQQACSDCRGTGTVISDPCQDCRGQGQVRGRTQIDVVIPAGVDTGLRLRRSGDGDLPDGRGAKIKSARGDLYIEIQVEEDEVFERDGPHLYVSVAIPFPVAALGGKSLAPTLEGEREITIPAGMKAPHRLTIKGEGVVDLKSQRRGDLIVEVQIETPDHLSTRAKELLKELDEELKASAPRDRKKSARKKKKGLFEGLFE